MTSFYPIYLFALNLTDGIEALQVENLAPPDTGCLHDYQLQMGDMKALAEADLFLVNGAGMENFLPLVTEALPTLTVCEATVGIELLDDAEQENTLFEAESEVNSHVWLDAKKAAQMVENLAAALMETYPQFDVQLTENRDGLLQRLEVLDEELRNGLSDLANRQIITFHEAFP